MIRRLAILGWALLVPLACAEGVQDNAPPDGFGSAATGNEVDSGGGGSTSGGANLSGAPPVLAGGQSGSVAGSPSAGDDTSGGSSAAGSATSGNSAGGASAGAPAGGSPSAGSSAGGAAAGGKGGTSAGGSSAGSASAGAPAGGATGATGFYVQYQNMKTASSSPYIGCLLRGINNGSATVAVNQFKLRYYFTDEVVKPPQISIGYSHVAIPGSQGSLTVTNTVAKLPTPTATADTYIEFSFSSGDHPMLAPQEVLEFTFQLQGPAPNTDVYTQNNDYSFEASGTLETWAHVVLYQGSAIVWGTPP